MTEQNITLDYAPPPESIPIISRRDYFAALAMQGFCSTEHWAGATDAEIAGAAVAYADTLIKALDSRDGEQAQQKERLEGAQRAAKRMGIS